MATEVLPSSIIVAAVGQFSCDLGEETVILNPSDGVYYGLDAVGSSVWNLVQERRTVREVRDALLREYDVDPERCERDLVRLLEKMAERGLIQLSNADATAA